MHLAIRADGGSEIGYGHLIRSNALAEEVLSRGHEISLATTTPQPARSVFPDSVKIVELPSRDEPDPFLDWINANLPDVVFTDSYVIDTEYQRLIRDRVPLAVLQDDNRYPVCADLFVNENLYASDLDYEFVGRKPNTCFGTDYVLLRSAIREWTDREPPWREEPERAIITMGGSDMTNQTPTAIRAFDGFDLHVDAIVGPGFSKNQEREICSAAKEITSDVQVKRNPDDLPERMFQADFAVSTSSSTTYELLALGTPIVSVPVADNQEPIARSLRKCDAATVLERRPRKLAFRRSIEGYLNNETLRKKRQNIGRKIVDGKGVERVIYELNKLVE